MENLALIFITLLIFILFEYEKSKRRQELKKKREELLKTVTQLNRGTESEQDSILELLNHGIPAGAIFHDLYVKKSNGQFSQIDLVVATKVGIIVIEVKDYSGWIFGHGRHSQWTQVLAYGREKHKFYNPVIQNKGHMLALRNQLPQFKKVPLYSVIVFYGDCELKDINFIPDKTFVTTSSRFLDVLDTINEFEPAHYTNKREIVNVLRDAVTNGNNSEVELQHIKNIKDNLGKHRILK
ncbi:MAG: NERD domain-containing protein [Alphaproteobacteria bacterium]|nr:NERD domain-containing protein [Alphaproteobacteria bacterium]